MRTSKGGEGSGHRRERRGNEGGGRGGIEGSFGSPLRAPFIPHEGLAKPPFATKRRCDEAPLRPFSPPPPLPLQASLRSPSEGTPQGTGLVLSVVSWFSSSAGEGRRRRGAQSGKAPRPSGYRRSKLTRHWKLGVSRLEAALGVWESQTPQKLQFWGQRIAQIKDTKEFIARSTNRFQVLAKKRSEEEQLLGFCWRMPQPVWPGCARIFRFCRCRSVRLFSAGHVEKVTTTGRRQWFERCRLMRSRGARYGLHGVRSVGPGSSSVQVAPCGRGLHVPVGSAQLV